MMMIYVVQMESKARVCGSVEFREGDGCESDRKMMMVTTV